MTTFLLDRDEPDAEVVVEGFCAIEEDELVISPGRKSKKLVALGLEVLYNPRSFDVDSDVLCHGYLPG